MVLTSVIGITSINCFAYAPVKYIILIQFFVKRDVFIYMGTTYLQN